MMINENQIKLINAKLEKFSPVRIGLFGSRIRGERKNSYLDIFVSYRNGKSPYSLLELLSLEKTLANKLGLSVKIINEKNLKNEILKESIIKDLKIIYSGGQDAI